MSLPAETVGINLIDTIFSSRQCQFNFLVLVSPSLLFVLAILSPWANYIGAHVGFLCGLGLSTWIYVGSKSYPPPSRFTKFLPTESIGCQLNASATTTPFDFNDWCPSVDDPSYENDAPGIANLYWISYMYMGTIGFIVTIVVASIVSVITNRWLGQRPEDLPKNVLLPCIDKRFPRRTKSTKNESKMENPAFETDL